MFAIVKDSSFCISLLSGNDLKENQRINELDLSINREKQKQDKKLTRQKVLLVAFLVDALEKGSVSDLREYTSDYFLDFFTRQGDKDLMIYLGKGIEVEINSERNSK